MATINNSKIIKNIIDTARIQTLIDDVPKELAGKVVPVLEVIPKKFTNTHSEIVNSASVHSIVYTTPTDKTFYLTNVKMGFIKDNLSTASNFWMTYTLNGIVQPLLRIVSLTLTADSKFLILNLLNPIKLDKNSEIVLGANSFLASQTMTAEIFGYLEDDE